MCESGFSANAAQVVCRTLHLRGGAALPTYFFGAGRLGTVVSNTVCTGSETTLAGCTLTLGSACSQGSAVGVQCEEYGKTRSPTAPAASWPPLLQAQQTPEPRSHLLCCLQRERCQQS